MNKEFWGIPEHLTSLYYTPSYSTLSDEIRNRHSMLYAAYLGEITAFFEVTLTDYVKRTSLLPQTSHALCTRLNQWVKEEAGHTKMFRKLNRNLMPEYYQSSDHYFITVSRANNFALANLLRFPFHFPLFIWLMLLQEERSLYYSAEILSSKITIDPRIVSAYRAHAKDETKHLEIDQELLNLLWDDCPAWKRRFNAKFLAWLIKNFFSAPRQSGLKVIQTLVTEFPALSDRWPTLRQQMLELSYNHEFLCTIYSYKTNPSTFERMAQYPEFAILTEALPSLEAFFIKKAA